MFGLFKKKPQAEEARVAPETPNPAIAAMRKVIDAQEASKPFLRAEMTGKDITANVIEMVKDQNGVRVENVLGLLGALAGYSCSYAVLQQIAAGKIAMQQPEVAIVGTKDGRKWMFGNAVNRRLVEGEVVFGQALSVWAIVSAMGQQLGAKHPLDLNEIFGRAADSIGGDAFGVADLPATHLPADTPQNFVTHVFPQMKPILDRYGLPEDQYFLALAMSIQEFMEMAKGAIDPDLAVKIVMEYAVPASKMTRLS